MLAESPTAVLSWSTVCTFYEDSRVRHLKNQLTLKTEYNGLIGIEYCTSLAVSNKALSMLMVHQWALTDTQPDARTDPKRDQTEKITHAVACPPPRREAHL